MHIPNILPKLSQMPPGATRPETQRRRMGLTLFRFPLPHNYGTRDKSL